MTATATKIEWTDTTWNPVTGCAKVSAGCKNCYAETFAGRGIGSFVGGRKFTDVRTHVDRLDDPLRWRKPRRVFVNSMSDLFHDDVPDDFIDRVFAVMAIASQHTFQVLTKRPQRMRDYVRSRTAELCLLAADEGRARGVMADESRLSFFARALLGSINGGVSKRAWPLPNVWLGVSVEDQRAADERIPLLLQTPAAVRFLSCEPLIGPVNLFPKAPPECQPWLRTDRIGWVIAGGESGFGARPCDVAWIRSIIEQCRATAVPAFVKQLGRVVSWNGIQGGHGDGPSNVWPRSTGSFQDAAMPGGFRKHLCDMKGGDPTEWPEDLRVREFPEAAQ